MAKLQKRTDSNRTAGKRPMDKIHVGFDVRTGEDGYQAVKGIVKDLRSNGYAVNDRALIIAIASEQNPKFSKALETFEACLADAEKFIQDADESAIIDLVTGEGEE